MSIVSHLHQLFNAETCQSYIHALRWKDRPLQCPRCQSHHVGPWGTYHYQPGLKRYRCKEKDCKRTFNDLTGTLLDGSKRSVIHLSLSRLNHGQPGVQAHPEIVQGATELHHQIADALLPQAHPVFHNATPLDAAIDMLDPEPPLVQRLVRPVLLQRQLLASGFLGRHKDLHLRKREGQEAQIL